jgi:hypothetical protein
MYSLKDAYNSDNSPTVATGVMSIGISLVVAGIGIFFVLSHVNNSDKKLSKDVAAIISGQAELDSLKVRGDAEIQDTLTAGTLVANNGATISQSLDVDGDTNLGAALQVDGETSLQGDLSLTGNAVLNGDLEAAGVANFAGNFTVSGSASVGSDLEVAGRAHVGSLDVANTAVIGDSLTVNKTATFSDALEVGGATILKSALTVGGVATFDDDVVVRGAATLQDALNVAGETTLSKTLSVGGATTLSDELNVVGKAFLGGDLLVQNILPNSPQPETTIGGNLTVTGNAELVGTVEVSGATTLNGTLDVTGSTITVDTLTANGDTTLLVTSVPGGPEAKFEGDVSIGGANLTINAAVTGSTISVSSSTTNNLTITNFNGTDLSILAASTQNGGTANGSVNITTLNVNPNLSGMGASASVSFDTLTTSNLTFGSGNLEGDLYYNGGDFNVNATINGAVGGITSFIGGDFNAETLTLNGALSVNNVTFGGTTIEGIIMAGGHIETDEYVQAGEYIRANGVVATFTQFEVHAYGPDDGDPETPLPLIVNSGKTMDLTASGPVTATACPNDTHHIRVLTVVGGIITSLDCQADGSGDDAVGNYDIAEKFSSTQSLTAGDVVSIDVNNNEYVVKSTGQNENLMIGVVSTSPGITLGEGGPGYPIALSGRVPVKVTDEGGAIAAGDYLTSSSTPGYAKKAAPGDKTIGQAMAPFTGQQGTVVMFVNTSGGNIPASEFFQGTGNINAESATFTSLNVSGPTTLSDLTVTGVAKLEKLEVVGLATLNSVEIKGHISGNDDTRGTVTVLAGQQTIHKDFVSAFAKVPAVVASPVNEAVLYKVTPTATGFDIHLTTPATADTVFNYLVQE